MKKLALLFLLTLLLVQTVCAQKKVLRTLETEEDNPFATSVDSFRTLRLMLCGNVYQTEEQINLAKQSNGTYNFKNELRYIQPILNLGDVTIGNLRTSFNEDASNTSAPDEFALALKYAGFSALTLANTNTANIEKRALKRTREVLNELDMYATGAFVDNNQRNGNYPTFIYKKGFKIALLNYSLITQRPSISRDFLINTIEQSQIERDMRLARQEKPDFIIVYFDWGTNLQDIPSYMQQSMAKLAFEQGANVVIGTHPNAPMRIDYLEYYYKGEAHDGVVAYSLGNLIGSTREERNKNSFVMDMEIRKNNFTNETTVSDWGIIPTYNYYDTASLKGKTQLTVVPCSNVESGEILKNAPYIEKRRIVNGAYETRQLIGGFADEIQYNLTEMTVNNVEETMVLTNASLNNKYSLMRDEKLKEKMANVNERVDGKPMVAKKEVLVQDTVKQEFLATVMTPVKVAEPVITQADTIYRIQFYALKKLLPIDTNYYTHLKGYETTLNVEDSTFLYLIGKFKKLDECVALYKTQFKPRYKQSIIVAYMYGRRVREIAVQ